MMQLRFANQPHLLMRVAAGLFAMLSGTASAATFNLYDEFPMAGNPTSPWGFYSQATSSNVPHSAAKTLLSVFEPAVPLVGGGFSPSFASWSENGAPGHGALVARHDPGSNNGPDVFFAPAPVTNTLIQFLLPGATAQLVNVVVDMRDGDPNPVIDGEIFSIFHNDALKFQDLLPAGTFAAKHYEFSVVMNPGDALYLVNDPINQTSADTLFVDMTVTTSPIPLPGMAWLFGATGLLVLRRRTRGNPLQQPPLAPAGQ